MTSRELYKKYLDVLKQENVLEKNINAYIEKWQNYIKYKASRRSD